MWVETPSASASRTTPGSCPRQRPWPKPSRSRWAVCSTSGTGNTDIATFNAAIANTWGNAVGNPIVIDSATQNIGGISFGGATGNYFIGSTAGNSLLLSSGGTIQVLGSLTATNAIATINAPLIIQGGGGTYTFANNSANGSGAGAGTLNFGGGITGGAAGATVLNLSGVNTNANTISGIIGNGSATSLAITKSGSGTWKLTGANTYTGATTINAGTLTLNAATGSLNSASALTFTGSGTFNMDNVGAGGALTQSLGALTFSSGDGTVKTTRTAAFDQAITFASLSARTAGASANFVNTGTNSATNGFIFTTAPATGTLLDRGYFYNGSAMRRMTRAALSALTRQVMQTIFPSRAEERWAQPAARTTSR